MASFISRSYILLGLPLSWWTRSVQETVPEPYLVCPYPYTFQVGAYSHLLLSAGRSLPYSTSAEILQQ